MKYLTLSGVPNPLSRIGLGCMRFELEREAESFSLMDTFVEHGGTVFDTAEIYGEGRSEIAVGEYLSRGGRSKAIIVTKGCVEPHLVRPDYIRAAIRGSLERLKTDVIDIYLLHRDDPSVPVSELLDVLNEAVNAGQIRAFGGSNWSTSRLEQANQLARRKGIGGFAVSSPHVALAVPRQAWWQGCTHATRSDLEWYAKQSMIVLGWSPRGRGFLGDGEVRDTEHLADLIRVYYGPGNLEKRQRLQALAKQLGLSSGQLAVAYVLGACPVCTALVGPRSREDLMESMAAAEIGLSPAEIRWLELGGPLP